MLGEANVAFSLSVCLSVCPRKKLKTTEQKIDETWYEHVSQCLNLGDIRP